MNMIQAIKSKFGCCNTLDVVSLSTTKQCEFGAAAYKISPAFVLTATTEAI